METTTKKPNLFAAAKKVEKSTTTTKEKLQVEITGYEEKLLAYQEAKAQEASSKTRKEMLAGELKEVAKSKWMDLYKEKGFRPESFNLVDGTGKVLCIIMDAYKKVEPEKSAQLEKYGVVETKTTYLIDKDMFEKYGDAISNAIMESTEIPDEDKPKIFKSDEVVSIKKGTIDRLLDFKENAEEVFYMIEPTVQFK